MEKTQEAQYNHPIMHRYAKQVFINHRKNQLSALHRSGLHIAFPHAHLIIRMGYMDDKLATRRSFFAQREYAMAQRIDTYLGNGTLVCMGMYILCMGYRQKRC